MELTDGFGGLAEVERAELAAASFGVMTLIENNHPVERTASAPVKNLVITTGVDGLAAVRFAADECTVCQKEDSFSEGSGTRSNGMAKIGTFWEW